MLWFTFSPFITIVLWIFLEFEVKSRKKVVFDEEGGYKNSIFKFIYETVSASGVVYVK